MQTLFEAFPAELAVTAGVCEPLNSYTIAKFDR